MVNNKLDKIDFIFLLALFSISFFIKVQTYPQITAVDEVGYWSETKNINPAYYYLGLSEQIPFHGPLFFYMNYFIVSISSSLLAFRMPSILFSFAIIMLFYIFAKTFFNRKSAFLASLLLVTSTSFNMISIYRIPHIDYCFFSLASLFLFILALKTDNGKYLICSFLFAGIAFLISILGVTLLAALAVSLLLVKNNFVKFSNYKHFEIGISKYFWIAFGALILLILICSPMQILKREAIVRYNNTKNLIQTEKSMWSGSPFSLQFINRVLFFEGGFSNIFTIIIIIGIIAAFIIPFKNRTLLPLLIYLIIYSFIMSFSNGMRWYIVPVVMFSYLFFSEAVLIIIKKIFASNEKNVGYISAMVLIIIVVSVVIIFNLKVSQGYYKNKIESNFINSYLYKDAYDYLKNKNESGIYALANICEMFRYYSEKDGFNATFFELPRLDLGFTLEETNKLLPPSHHYYDYVIQLYQAGEEINNRSNLYATVKDIADKCYLEKTLSNERFNDPNRKIFIFNCKNISLGS